MNIIILSYLSYLLPFLGIGITTLLIYILIKIYFEFYTHKCSPKIVDLTYQWWTNQIIQDVGEVLFVKAKDGTLYTISPIKKGQPNSTPTRGKSV